MIKKVSRQGRREIRDWYLYEKAGLRFEVLLFIYVWAESRVLSPRKTYFFAFGAYKTGGNVNFM